MIKAVIIDDETGSRKTLANLMEKYFAEDVEIIGEADGVKSGLHLLHHMKPDLVFLDIRMRDGTGFQLLSQQEDKQFQVIFITAHDQYAIRAFRFSAIDYLLKPLNFEDLEQAIMKAKHKSLVIPRNHWQPMIDRLLSFNHDHPTITVSTDRSIEFIKTRDIIRIESSSSYSTLFLRPHRKVLSSKTLKTYEDMLSDYGFFRIHQSHLINLSDVERFLRADGGMIEMKDGLKLPISRRRRDLFLDLMKA